MSISWLNYHPLINIMSTKRNIAHYSFSLLRPFGHLQQFSMFKGLFFLLIMTHFITCNEYHEWVFMYLSDMTNFRQSNIKYKTNDNYFLFSLQFRFLVYEDRFSV
jgi:hypothetical protein